MEVEKNYATWKNEFNYWMEKYYQGKDELPKNSFRADQVRPSRTTQNQAWKMLDKELGDQRKLLNGLLNEVTNLVRAIQRHFLAMPLQFFDFEQYGTERMHG